MKNLCCFLVAAVFGFSAELSTASTISITQTSASYGYTVANVVVNVTGASSGDAVSVTVGGSTKTLTVAGDGEYAFTFDGLTVGTRYPVTAAVNGGTPVEGEVLMANGNSESMAWTVGSTTNNVENISWVDSEEPVVNDAKYVLESESFGLEPGQSPLLAGSESTVYCEINDIEYVCQDDLVDVQVMDMQGALVLATNNYEDVASREISWYGAVNGAWTKLTGVATDQKSYSVKMEFDYYNHKVRYSVKVGVDESGEYTVLNLPDNSSGEGWLDMPASKTALEQISLRGSGKVQRVLAQAPNVSVAKVSSEYTSLDDAITNGVRTVTLMADGMLDISALNVGDKINFNFGGTNNYLLGWRDNNEGKYLEINNGVATVKQYEDGQRPANGYSGFESYLLGLDATNANSRPYLSHNQNANPNEMGLKVGGVTPRTSAGEKFRVFYILEECPDTGFSDNVITHGETTNGISSVALDSQQLRYLRVRTRIERQGN